MLHYKVKHNAVVSAIPYLLMWLFAVGSGAIADLLNRKKLVSLTVNRKIFITIGTFLPGVFCVAAVYCGCNSIGVIICFVLASGTQGAYSCGWSNFIDLSPAFATLITAVANTLCAIQGFLQSILVAAVIGDTPTFNGWRIIMWVVFGTGTASTIIYLIFGSAQRQQWDIDAALDHEQREALQQKKD